MKKVMLYLISFAFFCALIELSVNYSLGQQIEKQSPYSLSFSSVGANLLESRLDSWAKIKTASSASELDHYLVDILEKLQLPVRNHDFKHTTNKNIKSLEYKCQKSSETFQFILQSDQEQNKTDIFISIISQQPSDRLMVYERQLKQILDCTCYYLYSGYIDYNLEPASQKELLSLVLKKMEAQPIDIYQEKNVTSITAFSPILKTRPVNAGLSQVNLQTAMRCNRLEHRTYIYIGSPIILGEY
jgi:hypothetical protein